MQISLPKLSNHLSNTLWGHCW